VTQVPPRAEALRIVDEGYREVRSLIGPLPRAALARRRAIGGGAWSAKDLVGHISFWEENALEALEAWSRNEPAPIDVAFRTTRLNDINAAAVRRRSVRPVDRVLAEAEATHSRLVGEMRALTDERWSAPATTRARSPLGARLGSILGGPGGAFRHADAHLPDLRAFVGSIARRG
jgi:hypothetical protein